MKLTVNYFLGGKLTYLSKLTKLLYKFWTHFSGKNIKKIIRRE